MVLLACLCAKSCAHLHILTVFHLCAFIREQVCRLFSARLFQVFVQCEPWLWSWDLLRLVMAALVYSSRRELARNDYTSESTAPGVARRELARNDYIRKSAARGIIARM